MAEGTCTPTMRVITSIPFDAGVEITFEHGKMPQTYPHMTPDPPWAQSSQLSEQECMQATFAMGVNQVVSGSLRCLPVRVAFP